MPTRREVCARPASVHADRAAAACGNAAARAASGTGEVSRPLLRAIPANASAAGGLACGTTGPAAAGAGVCSMRGSAGAASVKATLSPAESQGLVDLLAAARMVTPGAVADAPAEGMVQAVVDPAWVAPAYKARQGRVLIVRHPGLGWMHFIFPEERAEQVSKVLAADLQPAPPLTFN